MTQRIRETRDASLPAAYLTPVELAELLWLPLSTIYQWRYQRIGPPGFRVGKHLRTRAPLRSGSTVSGKGWHRWPASMCRRPRVVNGATSPGTGHQMVRVERGGS